MIDMRVESRNSIKDMNIKEPFILISITDPGGHVPEILSTNMLSQLVLRFHDIEFVPGDNKKYSEYQSFTCQQARQILDFVGQWRFRNIATIVFQCEAGISRSAGVAAAIARLLGQDDMLFFEHYLPNRLVYRILIEVGKERALPAFDIDLK